MAKMTFAKFRKTRKKQKSLAVESGGDCKESGYVYAGDGWIGCRKDGDYSEFWVCCGNNDIIGSLYRCELFLWNNWGKYELTR